MLFTAKVRGRRRDLVGAGSKGGLYRVVDRDTGAIWLGSYSAGLSRFDPEREIFTNFAAGDDSLPGPGIAAIAAAVESGQRAQTDRDVGQASLFDLLAAPTPVSSMMEVHINRIRPRPNPSSRMPWELDSASG